MNSTKPLPVQRVALPGFRTWPRLGLFSALLGGAIYVGVIGCGGDADRDKILPAKVEVVTAYGQTLDESATPQQVAFVLLRAIADDVQAAQAHDKKKQKEAIRITHALGAYSTIEKRLLDVINTTRNDKRQDLGKDRDEELYNFTKQWAPIVSHYIRSFDTEFSAASQKMRQTIGADPQNVHVHYEATHDPSASDAAKADRVTIDIDLAKEPAGGKTYWRVARIGYVGRPLAVKPTTQPATTAPAH